jgi:hypothetical protein
MMKKALLWGAALCAALLFMGCPADEPPPPPQPFTLTVTGIPPGKALIGASLLAPSDITKPVAVGTDMTALNATPSGIYTFYHPGPDGRIPSATPFNTTGNYVLALAEVDMSTLQETAVYVYTGGGSVQSPVSFPVTAPLPWGNFIAQSQLGQQP